MVPACLALSAFCILHPATIVYIVLVDGERVRGDLREERHWTEPMPKGPKTHGTRDTGHTLPVPS